MPARAYNARYRLEHLNRVAFPLGGLGAGMVCLEGTGALSHVSVRHKPDVFNEPQALAALYIQGAPTARVLEGPVPMWKAFGTPGAANGGGKAHGLPRFAKASFESRFPFATVRLQDDSMPVDVELIGWSPFTPGQADDSSLPVGALEYRITNRTNQPLKAVFSYHAYNFMRAGDKDGSNIQPMPNGFVLTQPPLPDRPAAEGYFAAWLAEPAQVDCAWFRGGWFDALTTVWNTVAAGKTRQQPPPTEGNPGVGGSLYMPFTLAPKAQRTIRLLLAWYVPSSALRHGPEAPPQAACADAACACHDSEPTHFKPWYAARFSGISDVATYWTVNCDRLRQASAAFRDCFYDTTLAPEVVEAVAANLTILKSPTCLRQHDGRFWAWEGCGDGTGCCHGSCTHVWNYAQALPHLFPSLERSLRETEFGPSQDEKGHQNFRAALPIRPTDHAFHAAADGQLGGIMKAHREWRISGDTAWLANLWPSIGKSMDYCIATWDPDRVGMVVEPHHNTYDIEFWGPDGMCTSFYLGALAAAIAMGEACAAEVSAYKKLLAVGRQAMQKKLWNGEYFYQRVQVEGLKASDPTMVATFQTNYSPEARIILEKEGPKYQYGSGCLSDGVLGDWIARCCGVPTVLNEQKVTRHLESVFKYNFRKSLADHANPQRPGYAFGTDGGLLLCSWPKGKKPALPFVYSDEVWTGIEYQVASHLIMMGRVKEGLQIVRTVRDRYDGRYRNPFNEYECGHWYARAMSSYGLLQALTGARYDAVSKTLYLAPKIKGDFRAFLATATGYGTVGLKKGKPFVEVRSGTIDVADIVCTPA
jgi:uncharacterized protein (DUF608 family)